MSQCISRLLSLLFSVFPWSKDFIQIIYVRMNALTKSRSILSARIVRTYTNHLCLHASHDLTLITRVHMYLPIRNRSMMSACIARIQSNPLYSLEFTSLKPIDDVYKHRTNSVCRCNVVFMLQYWGSSCDLISDIRDVGDTTECRILGIWQYIRYWGYWGYDRIPHVGKIEDMTVFRILGILRISHIQDYLAFTRMRLRREAFREKRHILLTQCSDMPNFWSNISIRDRSYSDSCAT